MTVTPVEEAYTMLNKYNLIFNDGNAEKVDTLSYQWNLLKGQAFQVQNHLLKIQPEYKTDLLEKVTTYQTLQKDYVGDYTERYDSEGSLGVGLGVALGVMVRR